MDVVVSAATVCFILFWISISLVMSKSSISHCRASHHLHITQAQAQSDSPETFNVALLARMQRPLPSPIQAHGAPEKPLDQAPAIHTAAKVNRGAGFAVATSHYPGAMGACQAL